MILQYNRLVSLRHRIYYKCTAATLSLSLVKIIKKRKPGKAKVLLSYMCKYSESFITHLSNIFTLLLAGPIVPRYLVTQEIAESYNRM
jgi:hypothetical protein